ncbi:MAG: hypothetical protein L0Y66_24475, partial [Myxococcaceae bacterium]|nr:hypothetical protein [Myxococcaceae bacterium]
NRAPKEAPPDGRVEGESAERLVESAAGWTSRTRRGAFVAALLEVGLLERTATGLRVRGMSRYAAAHENALARSEKARQAAEARWAAARLAEASSGQAHGIPQAATEECSPDAPSNAPAMPGNAKTQTQTQSFPPSEGPVADAPPPAEERKASVHALKPKKPQKEPDPRHTPLRQSLEATYLEATGQRYAYGGADAKGITDLLAKSDGDAAEVLRRWRLALTLGARWPGTSSIAALPARWNDLGNAQAPPGRSGPSVPFQRNLSAGGDVPRF